MESVLGATVLTLCAARERPRLPLRGLAFERRQWRMQRERQAAAVRKCESEQPKHERLTEKGQGGSHGVADGKRESLTRYGVYTVLQWLSARLHRSAQIWFALHLPTARRTRILSVICRRKAAANASSPYK